MMTITPTDQTVYANLSVLSELVQGDKVTIDHQTGAITRHVPYAGESIGRWWSAAFNPDIVMRTFSRAFDLIDIENVEEPHVKTFGTLFELIPSGLNGVSRLRVTYSAKKNEKFSYELIKIHNEFEKKMKELQDSRAREETIVELDEEDPVSAAEPAEKISPDYGKTKTLDVRPLIKTDQTAKKVSVFKRIFCCASVKTVD